jgi:hypothetical protein
VKKLKKERLLGYRSEREGSWEKNSMHAVPHKAYSATLGIGSAERREGFIHVGSLITMWMETFLE